MATCEVGAVFPQGEAVTSPKDVRIFAEGLEGLGFDHVLVYDHVVGPDRARHPEWTSWFHHGVDFHEVFTLLSYLAATSHLGLVTCVLVVPQRQTALVAKQAAEVDWLSGGQLRLGVGIGWNELEYEALGAAFADRGRRLPEQIDVLRRMWAEESVDIESPHHRLRGVGLGPRPVQRPIPVWIGGDSEAAISRAGRLANGWFPMSLAGADAEAAVALLHASAAEAGRDPDVVGIEPRLAVRTGDGARVREEIAFWKDLGVSHLSFTTLRQGHETVADHLRALETAMDLQ